MRVAIGIDVAKNKSDVVGISSDGEIVLGPASINHDMDSMMWLVSEIEALEGDVIALMENTSHYWKQPAKVLFDAGIKVSVLNAILIHGYGTNTIRPVKTDKADARRIAAYALTYWDEIRLFEPEDQIRETLKNQARLYERICGLCAAMKNNLVAVCDQVNPGINKFYGQTALNDKGHYKWIDLLECFWHRDYILSFTEEEFVVEYRAWCRKCGYAFKTTMAQKIYRHSKTTIAIYPYNEETRLIVQRTAKSLITLYENLYMIKLELNRLASMLPEYETVMNMGGCGEVVGPLIMAEIGDVRRFANKKALIAYAGLDSKPYQSGLYEAKSRRITKKGSSSLRRNVFIAVKVIYMTKQVGNPVYEFVVRKREEGKHYFICMVAGCSKFLKIYYGTVKAALSDESK